MNRLLSKTSKVSRDLTRITRSLHPLPIVAAISFLPSASKYRDTTQVPWALFAASSALLYFALIKNGNEAECEADSTGIEYHTDQSFTNWSHTHECHPRKVYEPYSPQQVLRLLQQLHAKDEKIRPVGTCLSPNGISMSNSNLLSSHYLDSIQVDKEKLLVTVGGGARVSEVLKELNKHGLTLQNFSSIQEQQMAGWTQVAAHGTGASLPTVDDMIVRMKLATPTEGLMTLSERTNPHLFSFAKVGLGSLGVVTELTLKCIPKHSLLEHTFSLPRSQVQIDHYNRLENYRHVRYMWLPYTSQVVSVVSNPVDAETKQPIRPDPAAAIVSDFSKTKNTSGQNSLPTQPFIDALKEHYHKVHANDSSAVSKWSEKEENYRQLSFSQLRDELLELDPLNVSHIKSLNQAESKFWELSTGSRVDDSTNILGFDCGGEQFVYEICFPIGTLKEKSMKDIEFMNKLLHLIEINQIPAPCPIEHRWTSRSTSKMSPAYSENPEDVFAWIGIIMYIPKHANNDDMKSHENLREEIRSQFMKYMNLIQPLCEEYHATVHWAKIEIPHYVPLTEKEKAIYQKSLQKESGGLNWLWSLFSSSDSSKQIVEEFNSDGKLIDNLRKRIHSRYPIEQFNRYRYALDPKHMFSNQIIDVLFAPYAKDNKSPQQQQQTKK